MYQQVCTTVEDGYYEAMNKVRPSRSFNHGSNLPASAETDKHVTNGTAVRARRETVAGFGPNGRPMYKPSDSVQSNDSSVFSTPPTSPDSVTNASEAQHPRHARLSSPSAPAAQGPKSRKVTTTTSTKTERRTVNGVASEKVTVTVTEVIDEDGDITTNTYVNGELGNSLNILHR